MFSRNRQEKRTRRPTQPPLMLEILEDRTLLSASPTTLLDLNGLAVNPNQYSSTDILVQFQQTPGTPGGPALVAGTTLGSALPLETGFYTVDLSKGMTVAQALSAYKAEKGVLNAEPDYDLTVSSTPNDPLLSQQWALKNTGQGGGKPGDDIKAEQAWDVTTGNRNIVVAVLDTGVDYNDTDLAENIWINQADIPNYWYTKSSASSGYNKIVYKSEIKTATPGVITMADLNSPTNAGLVWKSDGHSLVDAGDLLRPISQGGWEQPGAANAIIGWNFVNNNNNPMDGNGHGTNVAGILGASGNNGTGVAGVDWNVQIMPVEFMGANGEGSVSNFIQALNFAVQNGAKITNNSWEGAPYSSALYDAFQNAQAHGVICVAAAGNEGSNDDYNPDYPANLSTSLNNVVTVAATTNTNQLASFSNYGVNSVDLAAPGVNILSTLPNNQYGAMSGTSMATPEVAGAMALVWSLHPNWSYTQVIDQVLDTTTKLSSLNGKVKSGGLLDVAAAVGYTSVAGIAPTITSVNAEGPNSTTLKCITVKFDGSVNASSFSSSAVTLTAPNGSKIPVVVYAVAGSNNEEFQIWFSNQSTPGEYHLSINSSVRGSTGTAIAPYQTSITLAGTQNYWNSTPTTIKPGSLTLSSMTLPSSIIGNVTVRLDITYPYDKDLYVYLISPTGQSIALDRNRGGWSANLNNTILSQQASTPIANGKAPFEGTFRPETSLNQLIGSNTAGTWRLAIRNSGNQYGKLVNWELSVTPAAAAAKTSGNTPSSPTNHNAPSSTAKTYTDNTWSPISPKGLAITPINVPAGITVGNVQVKVNVNYPNDKDLYIYLISPTGKTVALDYNRGGASANLSNTVFSQQASTPIADAKTPFTGTYLPEQSLNQLIGSDAGGTWRLAVRNYGTGSGALVSWSLILTPGTSTSSVAANSTESPASVASASSPSIAAGEASSLSVVASQTNTAPPPSAAVSNGNAASSWSLAWIDQLLSSARAWGQVLTSLVNLRRS